MSFKVKWRSALTDSIAMPLPRRQLVSLDAVRFWRFHTASAESSHPSISVDRPANLTRFRRRLIM
jgi:hypothetical protein